ncbi:DNA helicase [Salmonella enterica subsp. enterica serovar Panama]|uniref:MobH family relaxase n=1 Tax=Enterobacteriaceae TaxID=543 RepID=UPI001473AEB2|nr:MobH family relaxase [Salmonella enterica]EGO0259018.1 DNA helicase [Salmonella enterica subsp. enterica serovar Panama]EGP7450247.1 DNA helicase [Salmonella enterica subsp. enterica serovar Panama]NMF70812.1 DNA helicase [Salmonella enterica subsp. enterica serovar Panama]NMF75536.1 DNA helicase [Salmonella enterica subsp. enterica serovar Panama]NMF80261.1 DNA helicase [Salmonella enterica subsp. enterica serovar Panama]
MLRHIKNILNIFLPENKKATTDLFGDEIDASVDEEIGKLISSRDNMRYPASEIGFPAQVPGEYVLRHYQKPLVMAIKRELDIRDSEFNQLILPMLINFANFVHLFPASENHHHRAATGLLRHSLEVCFQCIRRSKNIEFDSMAVPVHKSNRALAWRLAVAAGGLLHDLGKPFTDFEVWNEDGKIHWPPGHEPIHVWAKENNVKRYYLVWKPGRHRQHTSSTSNMLLMIMPKEMHVYLLNGGNDIFNELTRALNASAQLNAEKLSGQDVKNKILTTIKASDSASVNYDMRQYAGDAIRASQSGVPAVQRVVDAMRHRLKKGDWIPNKPGSPVWVTTYGVFIVWGVAVKDIIETVRNSGAVIPQTQNSLADLMLSYHLCRPNVHQDDDTAYWRIAPHILNDKSSRESKDPKVALSCILLISPEVLFVDTVDPLPCSSRIRIEGKWVEYLTGRPNQPKLVESEPYIGQKPVPSTGIPNEVDRSVLQGGTIIADEQESPLESIFGNRQVTPENAHELLHKLNLLSDEDYNRVKERNTSPKNQKDCLGDTNSPTIELVGSGKSNELKANEPKPVPENNEPKRRLSLKETLASAQTEIEFSVPGSLIKEPNHKTLNETLEFHSIINSYNSNEPTSGEGFDQTQPSPTRQALKEIQLHQDAVDTGIQSGEVIDYYSIYEDYDSMRQDDVKADNDFGYSAHADTSANIPANVKFYDKFSQLYVSGLEAAKEFLVKYVTDHADDLFIESGHLIIAIDKDFDERNYALLQDSNWLWQRFMEAPAQYYFHRTQKCLYLRKELNNDIDLLMDGKFNNLLYSALTDVSDKDYDITDLCNELISKGMLKRTYSGEPVIAISVALKRRIADELGIDITQLQKIMLMHFDFYSKTGVDYILPNNERMHNQMVDKDE